MDAASLVTALKAAAEPTRLRILVLLAHGELNVKDLTRVLGQSQPRISRHLKLLVGSRSGRPRAGGELGLFPSRRRGRGGPSGADAGCRDRSQRSGAGAGRGQGRGLEAGARGGGDRILQGACGGLGSASGRCTSTRPRSRPRCWPRSGRGRSTCWSIWAPARAACWSCFAARCRRGIGIDGSQPMLAVCARAASIARGWRTRQVRQGDIYNLPLDDGAAGAVVMHQVLHFLADPARAVGEAARVLAPGGRLLLVDFAAHDLEFLRDAYAHVRLGLRPVRGRRSGFEMPGWS